MMFTILGFATGEYIKICYSESGDGDLVVNEVNDIYVSQMVENSPDLGETRKENMLYTMPYC